MLSYFRNYDWKIVSRFAVVFNKSYEFKLNIQCDLAFRFLR